MTGDPNALNERGWFPPPAGILDGTEFEIAQRYIDLERQDWAYKLEHPLSSNPDFIRRQQEVWPEFEELLAAQEQRIQAGDQATARLLTRYVERQVEELNRGERSTVIGQAHLFASRLAMSGHIWAVKLPDEPGAPQG